MKGWEEIKLGAFADFKNGLNFNNSNWGKGLKIIGVSDFKDRLFPDFGTLDEINPKGVARKEDLLQKGDILFVRSNGNRQLIGRCLYLKKLPEPVSHSGFTIRLRFKDDSVCIPFYVYLFKSELIRRVLSDFGGGTNINNLNQGILSNLKVPVPPFVVQQKIAAVLSAYDDHIENNKRRIALLEKMAEEIYREWFVRLRFPGHEKVKVVKGVPEGWDKVPLEKAFTYTGGGTPSKEADRFWKNGEINWYTPSDITAATGLFLNHSADRCTEEGLNSSSARLFPAYSIMMTSRATIGAIGINTTPACTNQGFITCIPNEHYPLAFLYHWLKLSKPHFELISGGATFAELTKGTFKRIEVLTPPKTLVQKFESMVLPMFNQIELRLKQTEGLISSRDMLLPRLISGKLSVENLNIQFPPSMENAV